MSERDSTNPNSGSFAHHLLAIGDETSAGAVAGITQNSIDDLGLASLQENTSVSVSLQVEATYGVGGVGFAAVRILNGVGAIVVDSGPQLLPAGAYQAFNLPALNVPPFGPPPNDVYAAFVEITANAGAVVGGSTSDVFVDDVIVDATLVDDNPPALPASSERTLILMGLLFVAALGIFGMRYAFGPAA